MATPVLRAPDSRLFGWELVGRHVDPFVVIRQFEDPRPLGLYTQPATDYVGAIIARITGGGVSAYNAVVLLTFPLAALFAYLLALELTKSRAAAWLAGLLYAFSPFHIAQAAYHPHGAQIQWLPLYFLALWRCLESAPARRLLLLAGSLALVASSNFYYGLVAGVLTPIAVFGFWWSQTRAGRSPAGLRRTLMALGALAAGGVAYVLAFAPAVLREPESLAFPRADLARYGAGWESYLVPPIGHPLFGNWVANLWERLGQSDVLEQQITVGVGLLTLALVAAAFYVAGERKREFAAAPALVLLAAVAFAVSLGPSEPFDPAAARGLLLPSEALYQALPMFRAYARFGLMVFLPVAILASAAAVRLLRSRSWLPRASGAALLALALVELIPFPPFRSRDVLPTSAHRFIEGLSGSLRVLDCAPPGRIAEQPLFYRSRHVFALRPGNTDCGDPDFATKLAHEGFTHLLVRPNSPFGRWLGQQPAPPNTRSIGRFEDALLFEIEEPSASGVHLEFASGFYWREYLDDKTYRWMSNSGSLTIINPGSAGVEIVIGLELHAFPEARMVTIAVDGQPSARLRVSTEPGTYELPPTLLSPGRHTLRLTPETAAVVADTVLGNGDARNLSVALWGWSLTPSNLP